MADSLKQTTQQTQEVAGEGTRKWEAMSEEQKRQTFDSLPNEQKQGKTYVEWIKEGYQHQRENWMPWIEDVYLKWFTKDNKASYATKGKSEAAIAGLQGYTLDKSKVTGVEQVDNLQDGVNNLVAGQVGQGGLLQPVGDAMSKEGINRAERQGKDDKGSYGGGGDAAGVTDPVVNNAKGGGEMLSSGAQNAGSSLLSGAKSAGGYVGGVFGGSGKPQQQEAEK